MANGRIPLFPLFALILGGLALTLRPGFVFFDEVAQAAGLTSLASGSLVVHDLPAPYNTGLYDHWALPNFPGQEMSPVGSTPLNLLALPILLILRGLEDLIGAWPAIVTLTAALAAGGSWGLFRIEGSQAREVSASRFTLFLQQSHPHRHLWIAVVFLITFVLGLLHQPEILPIPYLEMTALHVVNLAATAATGTIVFALARRHFTEKASLAGTILLLAATPTFYWAGTAKYHALNTLLWTLAVWAMRDGYRTPPARIALAVFIAALAAWNFLPFGFLLALSIAILLLPAIGLGFAQCATRWGAAAGTVTVGAGLLVLYRIMQGGARGTEQFIPGLEHGKIPSYLFDPEHPTGWLAHTLVTNPIENVVSGFKALFWTNPSETGHALALLPTVPWALLVPWVFSRRMRSKVPAAWRQWLVVATSVTFFVMGWYLIIPGGTPDLRYAAHLWPLVALASVPVLEQALHLRPASWWAKRIALVAVAAIAVTTLAVAFIRLAHVPWSVGWSEDATSPQRILGLAAAAGLAWAFLRRSSSPTPVVLAVALAVSYQVWMWLTLGKLEQEHVPAGHLPAPYVLAPLHWLHDAVMWFVFGKPW